MSRHPHATLPLLAALVLRERTKEEPDTEQWLTLHPSKRTVASVSANATPPCCTKKERHFLRIGKMRKNGEHVTRAHTAWKVDSAEQ